MTERLALWIEAVRGRARELRSDQGQAVVEYGVLLALILVAAIAVIELVGSGVVGTFSQVVSALT